MKHAKRVADSITIGRLFLGAALVWLGVSRGPSALPTVVWLMIINWTGDCLDGPIARKNHPFYHTWIGDHDLEIDMAVSVGLMLYLVGAGFVPRAAAGAYLAASLLVMWRLGIPKSLGMLFQAPIYGWFIVVAIRNAPSSGRFIPAWIIVAIIATWPRFPKEILPGFLVGIRHAFGGRHQRACHPGGKTIPQS